MLIKVHDLYIVNKAESDKWREEHICLIYILDAWLSVSTYFFFCRTEPFCFNENGVISDFCFSFAQK